MDGYLFEVLIDRLHVVSITTLSVASMVFIIESWGWWFTTLLKLIIARLPLSEDLTSHNAEAFLNSGPTKILLHFLLGILPLSMTYFFLGTVSLLFPGVVLAVGIIPAVISTIIRLRTISNISRIRKRSWYTKHGYSLAGFIIMLGLSGIFSFYVSSDFDATWYHIITPKMFLQNNNTFYLGELVRYSVHPFLNFFFNLYPLALPIPTSYANIVINLFQGVLVAFSIQFGLNLILKSIPELEYKSWYNLFVPSVLAFNAHVIFWLGRGYNDIYAYALGFAVLSLIFYTLYHKVFTTFSTVVILMILTTLALFKIFFILGAFWIGLFWVWNIVTHLWDSSITNIKTLLQSRLYQYCISFFASGAIIAGVFFVPWLVRSYIFTGRILDPVGAPYLANDVFNFEGSGNFFYHYTAHVWERLGENLVPFLITVFSPLVVASLIYILKKPKNVLFHTTVVASWAGLIFIHFASIRLQWRYTFPFVAFLLAGGVYYVLSRFKHISSYTRAFLIFVMIIPIAASLYPFRLYSYLASGQTLDDHTNSNYVHRTFSYYIHPENAPEGYSIHDTVLISSFHNPGLINNPIVSFDLSGDVPSLTTTAEIETYLNDNDVVYLLLNNETLESYCTRILTDTVGVFTVKKEPVFRDNFDTELTRCVELFTFVQSDEGGRVNWFTHR
jgi:hypothetical protein